MVVTVGWHCESVGTQRCGGEVTGGGVAGRIMVSQSSPHSNHQNLWICYVTWQGEFKVIDGMKVATQLILKQGDDYSGFPWVGPN